MNTDKIDISLVLPCYNEEASLKQLYSELKQVLDAMHKNYELIFIDDGSVDGTYSILERFYQTDPFVHVIRMRRNFGQTAALSAGFDYACGEIIISMDTDLQHDPKQIPEFYSKINEGFDIVSGWRKKRVDGFILRRIPSLVANRLIRWISDVELNDFGTTYKAYRSEVIKSIELSVDQHRFIPALAKSIGVEIAEIPIQNIIRPHGKSNYGIGRVMVVFLDIIMLKFLISYAKRPIQIFGKLGILSFVPGFLVSFFVAVQYYFKHIPIHNHLGNLILSAVLMLMGIQFIAIGMLAEINARIYRQTNKQLLYVVKKISSHRVTAVPEKKHQGFDL